MLQEYQLLYLDNDIPINRSFYCNNGDIKSRGLEVHVLDNSQAKDCTGLTLKMIIKVQSDLFESTVANGLVTVLNAATGIYQVLFPNNMGKGRLIAEIQISNAVPEVIVSRKFSIIGDGSLTSDGSISALPQGGKLWEVIQNEAQRQVDFDAILGSLDEEVALKYAGLETEYATELAGVKSQLADTVTIIKYSELITDYTSIIQTALDKKGLVKLVGAGTWITTRLLIDDDTTLEVGKGVILKRKDASNHYMIVNKGHVLGYRNKNITLKGGKWDCNRATNTGNWGDLSVDPQSWSGLGILMRGIDNLTIEDVEEIGNEWKYCYLITDINHGTFRNINMINESDGLHFQPPLRNILIENIKGNTQDDLISFTMGDYPRYSLGQTGDIENVICRNIYGSLGTDELIKMVGSGIDGLSVFRNMKFENLLGYSSVFPVCIMREDQAAANPCLLNTKLENIVFENIDVKVSGAQSYFSIGAASGDITIRKLKMYQKDSLRPIIFDKCNLSKVILEDVEFIKSTGAESTNYLIRVQNPKVGESIEHLIIKDSNFKFNASGGQAIYPAAKSVKNITFENSILDGTGIQFLTFDGVNTDGTVVNILNSKINCAIFCYTSEKANLYLTNSQITTVTRTVHMVDGANIRVVTSSDLLLVVNGFTASRFMSINGLVKTAVASANLTPLEGDSHYDMTTHTKKTWNGTAWI